MWISASLSQNKSSGVLVYEHCPYGYCKPENISVDQIHSVAKLFRTIITALGFAVLDYPDGPVLLWSFDATSV